MAAMEGPGSKTEGFSLMTGPPRSSAASKQNQRTSRAAADYNADEERFKLDKRTFRNQYAQTYFFRLQRMEPQLREKIKEKWPDIEVTSVVNVPENKEIAVIGTLYKEMKLKPSILAEYNTKDHALEQLIGKSKFAEASDSLVLEDVSVRMQLKGTLLNVGELVTGVVAAFKGTAAPGGDFWVSDLFFAGWGPQPPLPPADGKGRYIAFVSGLAIGEEAGNPASLSLLVDFLTGMLGSPQDQALASQVVRIVIAGGLMCSNEMLSSATTHTNTRQQSAALMPVSEMDMAITELASTAPVDIMPGASDPASRSLPQQPLHHCLFPCASTLSTVSRVTNPHEFEVDGLTVLGTSGQNVDDVYKYSEQEDRLGILQTILEWGHLAPTAPDTLSSYPYATGDPFLLEQTPHVLFAGNQPQFQTRIHTGPAGQRVLLLCVPKFSDTETLVLVNARNLNVHPIYFSTALS